MTMSQLERDREGVLNDIMKMAVDFRTKNRLFHDDPVYFKIPAGQKHLIKRDHIEQLKVFNIFEEK